MFFCSSYIVQAWLYTKMLMVVVCLAARFIYQVYLSDISVLHDLLERLENINLFIVFCIAV